MEKIIVIVAEGKGRVHADWITLKLFDTLEEANNFIKKVNDLESKYWTYAEVVDNGERLELYYHSF